MNCLLSCAILISMRCYLYTLTVDTIDLRMQV
jgi:hypothetical protein